MPWRKKITDLLADLLRFSVRAALLFDVILLSIASVYITARFCWHFIKWLDRILFANPW